MSLNYKVTYLGKGTGRSWFSHSLELTCCDLNLTIFLDDRECLSKNVSSSVLWVGLTYVPFFKTTFFAIFSRPEKINVYEISLSLHMGRGKILLRRA